MEKTKHNTTKAHIRQSKNTAQHKINTKKLKPGLVSFYDIRRRYGAGLFSKEKISKGGDKQGKSEENWISGEAYDINKQTIYSFIRFILLQQSATTSSSNSHWAGQKGCTDNCP